MATIAARGTFVLAPTSDQALLIGNEELLRKLSIGNNWTSLRIGAMIAITPDGTNSLASCKLMLGVCSANATFSNTAGYSAASTTNYVGADLYCPGNTGTPETAVYQAGSGNPYFYASNATFGVPTSIRRRVATTETFAIVGGNSQRPIAVAGAGSTLRRCPVYVDIIKGSPNYTVNVWNIPLASSATDFSYAHFLTGFETASPVLNGVTLTQNTGSPGVIACSEVAGNFDTVSVFWNRLSFPLEVYALGVRRLS